MTQTFRVLIIDNNPDGRGAVAAVLADSYQGGEAATAAGSLEIHEAEPLHCLVVADNAGQQVDIPPDLLASGTAVVRLIEPGEEHTAAAIEAGCHAYLARGGYGPAELLHAVAGGVESTQLKRTVARQSVELKQAVARTANIKHELQQFAYAVSHDLQEPLRSVVGFCGLLEKETEGSLSDRSVHFLEVVVACAHRTRQMIEDLLVYSRVESRAEPFKNIQSKQCIDDALVNLNDVITRSNAKITLGALPGIIADHWQIVAVFQNFIGNAIKFRSDKDPFIHIEARRDGDMIEFSVADNGIGIDPRFHEDIFKVFRRLHTRDEHPGNGIGLAVCKRTIERHGGTVRVSSSPGTGAIFNFRLPASQEEGGNG